MDKKELEAFRAVCVSLDWQLADAGYAPIPDLNNLLDDSRRYVAEMEKEIEKEKCKIAELENLILTLSSELSIRALLSKGYFPLPLPPEPKTPVSPSLALSHAMSKKQIELLGNALHTVFDASPSQWQSLFSESEIRMPSPIKAQSISDVGVLLHYLSKHELILSTKYPSIIERTNAFAVKGSPVKAKSLNDLKGRSDFPDIGKNYVAIERAVLSCK